MALHYSYISWYIIRIAKLQFVIGRITNKQQTSITRYETAVVTIVANFFVATANPANHD